MTPPPDPPSIPPPSAPASSYPTANTDEPTEAEPITEGVDGKPAESSDPFEGLWGKLVSCNSAMETIDLHREKSVYRVGRLRDADIVISNPKISSRHCELRYILNANDTATVAVIDFSTNGTYVNGVRLGRGRPSMLNHGDELSLALTGLKNEEDFRFIFRSPIRAIVSFAPRHLAISSSDADVQTSRSLGGGESNGVAEGSSSGPLDLESLIGPVSSTPINVNGHFCDVFQGVHSIAGKVALKRLRIAGTDYDGDAIRRFEREAATWKHLRHPHILEFLGTLKRDGHLYLVSPFITNGTLMEYLFRHPNVKRIRLLCETADAIQYLRSQNVVHGDIKGTNILISDDAHVLLCDFGLTKMIDSRTSTSAKGSGSVRWMSPELWDNEPRTFESDVYAFGMTIAEVLTGQAPLSHLSTSTAVMMAVMTKNERPLRDPTSSPDGESYEETWNVAAACWPTSPSERISIAEAHHRLLTEHSASR